MVVSISKSKTLGSIRQCVDCILEMLKLTVDFLVVQPHVPPSRDMLIWYAVSCVPRCLLGFHRSFQLYVVETKASPIFCDDLGSFMCPFLVCFPITFLNGILRMSSCSSFPLCKIHCFTVMVPEWIDLGLGGPTSYPSSSVL